MSRISRNQIKNKREYAASKQLSVDSKHTMEEKYAKNLLMMEQLRQDDLPDNDTDSFFKEQGIDDGTSGDEGASKSLVSEQDGENGNGDGDKDNNKDSDMQCNLEKQEELQKPIAPLTSPSLKPNREKVVDQEYIKACLAAAEEKEKKTHHHSLGKNKEKNLSDDENESLDKEENNDLDSLPPLSDPHHRFRRDSLSSFSNCEDAADRSLCSTEDGSVVPDTVLMKYLQKFEHLIRKISKYENVNRFGAIVMFYVIGVVFYIHHEDWSVSDTIYFITVSITTVGFGDLVPTNDTSKLFTMLYAMLGLVVIFSYVNHFAETLLLYAEKQAVKMEERKNRNKARGIETDGVPYQKYRRKMMMYLIMIIIVISVGTMFYMYNEEWTFMNALYFSFIATMTIGYGDPVLQNPSSRTFSIFYVLFSVVIIAMALGNIGAIKLTIRQEKKKFEMLHKKLDLNSIIAMDDDGDGVDRVEFLTAMLMQMNGLSKEDDIDPWLKRFEELDKDGSGTLDQEDLRLFAEEEEIRKQCRREVRQRLEEKQGIVRCVMDSKSIGNSFSNLFGSGDDDEDFEDLEEKEEKIRRARVEKREEEAKKARRALEGYEGEGQSGEEEKEGVLLVPRMTSADFLAQV